MPVWNKIRTAGSKRLARVQSIQHLAEAELNLPVPEPAIYCSRVTRLRSSPYAKFLPPPLRLSLMPLLQDEEGKTTIARPKHYLKNKLRYIDLY